MGWPWDCGLGVGQLALALSVLALLTSLSTDDVKVTYVLFKELTQVTMLYG